MDESGTSMNLIDAFAWIATAERWAGPGGIWIRLLEHLGITFLAVFIAAVLAVPAGILIGHSRKGAGFVGGFTGAFRALPTLGLLTLFGLVLGIGLAAPLLALVILAIPSLLAGAYSGIQSIDPVIPGAARAIGMSPSQVIRKVEIPLAMPVMVGGLRAAVLQVVATATMAAYTADVGLGRYLFAGMKTRDYPQMLASALLVTALAIALELTLGFIQRKVRNPHV